MITGIEDISPTRVNVAGIGEALDQLWGDLHTEGEVGHGVTRACMSNLIIACQTEAQADDVRERIPALVERHPARLFLLTACRTGRNFIEADVSAHCRRTVDDMQLCSEHVDIRFDESVAERLGSVLRPLLIGDLPSALWWASNQPPPLSNGLFDVLEGLADQVIYDSVGWPNPPDGVRAMTDWIMADRRPVSNLAWRYLKPWRRILAQVFDPKVVPGALKNIESIRLEHGPHGLPVAWLLVSWLADRLNWKPLTGREHRGDEVSWKFSSPQGDVQVSIHRTSAGPAQVNRLDMSWKGQDPGHAGFVYGVDNWLILLPDESTLPLTGIPAQLVSREMMIAAQLAHRSKDMLFGRSIVIAHEMANVLAQVK